jgi:hypothetical protein
MDRMDRPDFLLATSRVKAIAALMTRVDLDDYLRELCRKAVDGTSPADPAPLIDFIRHLRLAKRHLLVVMESARVVADFQRSAERN